MTQTLFSMLGYPGSGKSYFAKHLAREVNAVRLNSDSMRSGIFGNPDTHHGPADNKMVYGAIDYAVREIMASGYSVIYDANCNHIRERSKNAALARSYQAEAIVIWIQTPFETAVERGALREVAIDQTRLTPEIIQHHIKMIEDPTDEEKCVVINGELPFEEQYEQFKEQMKKYD